MKTKLLKNSFLLLILLTVGCGKAPEEEGPEPFVDNSVVSNVDTETQVQEVKDSVTKNDLEGLKKLVVEDQLDLKETMVGEDTLLIAAIKNNSTTIVEYLLKLPVNVEETNALGETPLMIAAGLNRINFVQALLDKNALWNRKDNKGNTALHTAIKKKSESIALLLIKTGASIEITDGNDRTPYQLAEEYKQEKVKDLISSMIQVAYGSPTISTFRNVITTGDLSSLNQMLKKFPGLGIDYESINPLNILLSITSENSGLQMAKLLLDNQTNVNGPKDADYSPLIGAVLKKKISFLELFLSFRADTQLLDKNGRSALVHAVSMNDLEMTEALLNKSAIKKYSFKRDNKKITLDTCDVARAVGKATKDKAIKAINKQIKDKLDCGFWDWVF